MAFKGIGILSGRKISFLDHLIPLCSMMGIPLYCTDRWTAELADIFYPSVSLVKKPLLESYDAFFYVELSRTPLGSFDFRQFLHTQPKRSVFGFHGNSDKNLDTFWIERLVDEDLVLVYGDFFIDCLKDKGVWPRLNSVVRTGNYRLNYYEKQRAFFERVVNPYRFSASKRKTILYAPTWCYPDRHSQWNSSFFDTHRDVLESIPEDFQIFVKLHPYYFSLFPKEVADLKKALEEHEQIRFLDETPLIYPFLEQADIYLGDYSSVGYDFLAYNRPMFFLSPREDVFLHRCGRWIAPKEYPHLYSILRDDRQETLRETRQQMYHYVFGDSKAFERIAEDIQQQLAKQ